jgi:creatinine amidohydrolase
VNYIADLTKPEMLLPENGPATFAWLTKDIAPSGVLGDPRPSTPEKGRQWLAAMARKVADALLAMAAFKSHYPQ